MSLGSAFIVVMIVAFFALLVFGVQSEVADEKAACEAKGGTYLPQYRGTPLCLKKDAVIP